ncbi:B12-binding domain-containing radical SAM protein [Streptomyces sp. NPDC051109]|uniref:B12-binding domain-containing radical SAM protein n=1 Tax=Streptomyces sp. NPDC051109 TaxID=3365642 RepID=UPI003787F7F3
MRIVLCDNVLINQARPDAPFDLQPHLGLLSLSAVAREHGHTAAVFDPSLALHRRQLRLDETFYRGLAWALLDEEPDALGLTTLGCNLICTAKVASHVKRQRPHLPILLGGPHATILHRELLRHFDAFDIVVRGEAEAVLPALLDRSCADDLSGTSGLSYRVGDEIVSTADIPQFGDLDELPFPAYDLYPIAELGLHSLRVEAGRDCPFSCTFCSTASFFGRRYRLKSSERLVSELDHLNRTYGINDFALTHDMFTANKHKVRHFCETVAGRGYTWSCSARMDCVDSDLLATMHESGCRSIYYGVETGSARMQKISRKHLDLGLVHPTLDLTGGLGMKSTVSLITGFPEETSEDQDATLDLLGECTARSPGLINLQLHLLTPEPGTALHDEYGERLAYDGHISDFNFPTLEPDDSRVMSELPQLFMNHHYYPTALTRSRHLFVDRAFPLLYALGHSLLRRMLHDFDGRLSSLVRELHTFADAASVPLPDGPLLVNFVRHTWGAAHPICSTVRFLVMGEGLRAKTLAEPADEAGEGVPSCRLSPSAGLLRDMHDVPSLLDGLQLDQAASAVAPTAPDRNLLLFVDAAQPDRVRSFDVDGIALEFVAWLAAPRSGEELSHWLSRHDDQHGSLRSFAGDLCRLGVLLDTTESARAPRLDRSPV